MRCIKDIIQRRKNCPEELISTSNDPVDTLTISFASGNGFKLFVERTGEEFEIANQHDIELGACSRSEFVTPLEVRDNSQVFLKMGLSLFSFITEQNPLTYCHKLIMTRTRTLVEISTPY